MVRYECTFCKFSNKNISYAREHVNKIHLFKCDSCKQLFNGRVELIQHKNLMHRNERKIKCNEKDCNYSCDNPYDFRGIIKCLYF